VGIGLEEGIMTVVIKEAQDKNIFQISDELQEYITKLKTKKLSMEHMMGSTYTISNMGMLGVEQFTPFLNPPETGILGIGITKKQLVVNDDGSTSIHNMTCFTNTLNHAAVDGLHGGLYFLTLKEIVENPDANLGL
jgi:pyruvate dehydrogenase E2 component (dihydrolipoamide acetyltransferase)